MALAERRHIIGHFRDCDSRQSLAQVVKKRQKNQTNQTWFRGLLRHLARHTSANDELNKINKKIKVKIYTNMWYMVLVCIAITKFCCYLALHAYTHCTLTMMLTRINN